MFVTSMLRQSKGVFIDTAPLIYYIEAHPEYAASVKQLLAFCLREKIQIISSVITLHEVLVKPYRDANQALAEKFASLLKNNHHLNLIPVSEDISEAAAKLRGNYQALKMADALQIATALHAGADIFLTNDKHLKQLSEIKVVIISEWPGTDVTH